MNRETRNKIIEAVVLGIQRNGDRIFDISQQKVPVDTGNLKRSGFVNRLDNGIEMGYRAPYAAAVENGIPRDVPITGTQVVHRRGYTRRDGTYVPPQDIVYRNKRLIPMGRGRNLRFRVIDTIRRREGVYFLLNSIREGIRSLPDDVRFGLERKGLV